MERDPLRQKVRGNTESWGRQNQETTDKTKDRETNQNTEPVRETEIGETKMVERR